jgi:hypothetical protein
VLRPGGTFVFNVWDRIEENEFADVVTKTVGRMFPADPPLFMIRTPHGYHDSAIIARDLAAGGFGNAPQFEKIAARSRAESARTAALALCEGTPLRHEVLARSSTGLADATSACAAAIAERFGQGPVDGKIQGYVVSVQR